MRHCQWRCVIASVPLARLSKDVTGSSVFFFVKKKNLEFALFGVGPDISEKNSTPTGVFQFFLRKKLKSKKRRKDVPARRFCNAPLVMVRYHSYS
jgi:hypothetical protein